MPINIEFDVPISVAGKKTRLKNGFDALKEIVAENKIYYSKAETFNDPFEFDGVMLNYGNDDQEKQVGYSLLNRSGIICFSSQVKNTLMWSHYADSHRGVALRFKCEPDPFFSTGTEGRVVQVTYGDDIIFKNQSVFHDSDGIFEKFSRKACCWSYEEEFRVFKVPTSYSADDAAGIQSFNSNIVDAIYLGLRASDETINRIRKIINNSSHEILLYKSSKSKSHLFIEFEQIEN